jgi:hypothetical protein
MAAVFLLSAQPCLAADDFRSSGAVERRSGAFAGMSVRLPMGQVGAMASARLQLATIHHAYDRESRLSGRSLRASGVELGLSGSARPALYIGGRNAAQAERKLQLKGSGTTIVLVGAAILVSVLLLASLASAAPTPGPHKGAFD